MSTLSIAGNPHVMAASSVCTNCSGDMVDVYCARCGERQPDHHDLTLGHIAHEAFHELVHLDSKLFVTLRLLVSRPGMLTKEYFAGRKQRYIAPLRLFLTLFALYLLVYSVYKPIAVYTIEAFERFDARGDLTTLVDKFAAKRHLTPEVYRERVDERWHKYVSYTQFASVLALAVVLKVLFRRRRAAEHLVFAAHYLAFTYLVAMALWPVYYVIGFKPSAAQSVLSVITMCGMVLYTYFGLRRFYEARGAKAVIKSGLFYAGTFLATLVTMFGSMIAAMALTR